jgi:hypothetical protein
MKTSFRASMLALGLLAGLIVAQGAFAQQPRSAHVYSEDSQEMDAQCGVDYEHLRSIASSTLRQKGYKIVDESNDEAINVFIFATSLFVRDFCAVHLEVRFGFFEDLRAPWGQKYEADVVVCRQNLLQTGWSRDMNERLRTRFVDMLEMCISEEEQQRR